ncbi:MAG: sugar ABC transporter ATP-binding protein [Chloroflexota bacterium]
MTAIATASDLLLEATDVSKAYGAVVALKRASLAVRRGEVHALMGANGAGKSTLVKILSGGLRADTGRILVRGRESAARSPGEARRNGIVSVYQEPSLIPDLDLRSNLRLTRTPVDAFRHWANELGLPDVKGSDLASTIPLAAQRVVDLARALALEPDVLMLDEITAALPANLTERVLEVVGRLRGGDRSVIFISHRMIEIGAVCDRATVLREGETVGVVDVTPGSEERIVQLMLGEIAGQAPAITQAEAHAASERHEKTTPRLHVKGLAAGTHLHDVAFELFAGEVLGVVALEGQGQDELFDVLAGSRRSSAGEILVEGSPITFHHPADAIRAGLVYVAADRAEALLMQRNVRENITLPTSAQPRHWGLINSRNERKRVYDAVETLQIDARAGAEVRRLSGGNQQKVTIARWVAGGVKTMLCFDPTRGIDIRTKNQIYGLLRDLAAAGAAVLLYTSELKEIQLVCDRAIVIFGGRVVAELPAAQADEAALLRAAYNLKKEEALPEATAAEAVAAVSTDSAGPARAERGKS